MKPNQLRALAEELRTQDNASTGHPLFLVQQKRRIWIGTDVSFDDCKYEWQCVSDWEYRYPESEIQEQIRDQIAVHENMDAKDVEVFDRDPECYEFEKSFYVEHWEYVTAHLTRKAAQRYIDGNKHNMTEPRIYVGSQYRCHEFNAAVEFLKDNDS